MGTIDVMCARSTTVWLCGLAACLTLAGALYGQTPQGLVVSVRGYQFGFKNSLSPATATLAEEAFRRIVAWLDSLAA